ncbi:HupE/UreJ family protein [Archangium violaceum]|uniref:HupE/UreJ family protein n=1 Tax=Archangium violaceum TaxID=83451 RepID=UPI00194E770C|nr:HupE/UreJ family protein [Archangium violaceum]QRN95017.1 HupE/UreJ family protein [Archangium violaceum]
MERATAVLLDLREHSVEGELQLPLDQLGLTLHHNLGENPSTLVARMGSELARYIAEHVAATAPDGRAFDIAVRSLEVRPVDGANCLVALLSMQPPPGAATGAFTLRYDAIVHRVVTHKVFVSIRSDFKNGVLSDQPELLGVLRYRSTDLVIDRSNGTWWKGFRSVFVLGVRHIAEGTDHLLFLLVLLLAAPWSRAGPGGERPTPCHGA